MGILVEKWAADIAKNLFPDNSFLTKSKNDSGYVGAKSVNLPQSGTMPNVVKNRATLPAAITTRTDTVVKYDLNAYSSDPTLIERVDELEVSYDKQSDVLENHISQIDTKICEDVLQMWAPNAVTSMIRTSGAARASSLVAGAGTRKAVTLNDILAMRMVMNRANVPLADRYILLPPDFEADLLAISDIRSQFLQGTVDAQQKGIIGTLFGFNVMIRSSVLVYTNATTPVMVDVVGGTALGATHNQSAIAWHKDFVRSALESVKVFTDLDKPEYYGSMFSAQAVAGGVPAYTDKRGVVALVEA
jgi:hypothetical protein